MNKVISAIGISVSFTYLLVVGMVLFDRVPELATLGLNEVGDFLAGVFSPLALLWLVLGFFQQGLELRASRDALHLQAAELKNSVEQQQKLVEVSRDQLKAEIEAREQERQYRYLESQPVFDITAGKTFLGVDSITSTFVLRNLGFRATQLRTQIQDLPEEITLPSSWATFAAGEQCEFHVRFSAGSPTNFLVFLLYRDGLGSEQRSQFIFEASHELLAGYSVKPVNKIVTVDKPGDVVAPSAADAAEPQRC